MTILTQLKKESLRLRKERNPLAASITFAISEIDRVGKNAGNRDTTEDEAIKAVQKLVSTLRDNLQYNLTEADREATEAQIAILSAVLPTMLTDDETASALRAVMESTADKSKGSVMKTLREIYGARIDLKKVGTLMKDM